MKQAILRKLADEKEAPLFLMQVALGFIGVSATAAVVAMFLAR